MFLAVSITTFWLHKESKKESRPAFPYHRNHYSRTTGSSEQQQNSRIINVHSKVSLKGSSRLTGASSYNVHSKVSLKGSSRTTGSTNNVHSKVSLKCSSRVMFIVKGSSRLTEASSNNVHSKVSLKGSSRVTGASHNNVHSKMQQQSNRSIK